MCITALIIFCSVNLTKRPHTRKECVTTALRSGTQFVFKHHTEAKFTLDVNGKISKQVYWLTVIQLHVNFIDEINGNKMKLNIFPKHFYSLITAVGLWCYQLVTFCDVCFKRVAFSPKYLVHVFFKIKRKYKNKCNIALRYLAEYFIYN